MSRSLEDVLQERTGLLQLQQVIAVTANESDTVGEALQGALNLVCAYTGWPVGHVQLAESSTLVDEDSQDLWFTRDENRYQTFRERVQEVRRGGARGLLASVLAKQQPLWLANLGSEPDCVCRPVAAEAGLVGYVAVPIRAGDSVVGVLEFFTAEEQACDERLLQVLQYVSSQVGRVCERQRMEDRLRQSEEHFRSVVENSSDIIVRLDPLGIFRYVSPAAESVLGYAADDLVGRNAFELIHPDDVGAALTVFGEALQHPGETKAAEFRFQHVDGTWRAMEARGRSVTTLAGTAEVTVTARDITSRRLAEEQLRLQSSALETAANGILITDTTGTILWVNPAYTRLTGYSAAESIGQTPGVLKSGKHGPDFYRRLWGTVKAGKVWRGEITNRRKDGTLYDEDMTITPVRDINGVVSHFIAIKQDITERKRAEAELRTSNERLQQVLDELRKTQQQVVQQERLRALGTMASGIAHDFNNALAPVLGFSELLLHRPETWTDRAKTERYLKLINTAAQDAASVVRRLREFYRHREADEPHGAVELNQLVKDALALTQPKWKAQAQAHGVSIEVVTMLEPLTPIGGNEADLREVLTNLIFNAVDAMPGGGTLTVRTRMESTHAVLTVADTGTGMSEEVRQRCLEPFFSTKGNGGTGLGLSMVYGIVQRHDGHLEIESQPGQGTVFHIHLPLLGTRAEPDPVPRAVEPSIARRILVIDDEEPVRTIVGEMLRTLGHEVILAESGRQGIDRFRHETVDLVVVDRAMPVMNGDQVAAALKSLAPELPIILLTGFGSMMLSAGEHPPHVDLVLGKPVTLAGLRDALDEVSVVIGPVG